MQKSLGVAKAIFAAIDYFFIYDWRYHSDGVIRLFDRMSDEEKVLFDCDIRKIEWKKYIQEFMYGTHVYALKEANIAPKYQMKKIMPTDLANSPIRMINNDVITRNLVSKSTAEYESSILNQERFNDYYTQRAP